MFLLFFKKGFYMFKIKFLPTGHIFVLPENEAKELKEKSPEEYLILEKNGKKFKDKPKRKQIDDTNSILAKVLDN